MMLLRIPVIGSNSNSDILTSALARLSVLGTVVLGALSGFGAIATAWMFADALGKKRWAEITKQDIANAENSLGRVRSDLEIRSREAQALELQNTKSTQNRSWGSRFLGAFGGESEMTSLRREIAGLRALEFEMARELEQMRTRQVIADIFTPVNDLITHSDFACDQQIVVGFAGAVDISTADGHISSFYADSIAYILSSHLIKWGCGISIAILDPPYFRGFRLDI
ncbi:hypothetical protein FRC07_004403 [Ceratobasidium sp. 392]|nr:hypothetical protein FRC07_004403 [Ceratobasidium sp. 392]